MTILLATPLANKRVSEFWPKISGQGAIGHLTLLAQRFDRRLAMKPYELCLVFGLLFALGCGDTAGTQQPSATLAEDPEGEFEWGVERLKHALRTFSPDSSNGLNITGREVDPQLFPPSAENPTYTARVTITTETSFLHAKRKQAEKFKQAPDSASRIKDPLADPADELNKLIDIPGTGPQAPDAAATRIEPLNLEQKTVFEMAYVEGHWKLTEQPELKHEQLWFKYAFE